MSEINYQALREKAEKATKGSYIVGHTSVNQHGNLTGVFVCQKWKGEPGGVIAECHVNCLIETDAQAYANAEFIAEANPATVLALLDEQERNQQYIKRRDQENEDIALTVGKLRVELEAAKSKLNEQREYYEGVISDGCKRIAELEAREVQLPTRYDLRYGHPINADERQVMIPKENGSWLYLIDLEHALRVADIRIKGE
ncbi:TPA: ead/Ea22-like family protein [Escherichia coli]|nr:ead/Ea22-like family protein [Escherichia coli]KDA79015.1 ead/Ea22-like family protein [Escherichia coli 2-011-08_S3_C2]KDU65960.1 ead/Ea22-like family protein [Escherichia coli 4-203-08_S4_C3]KDW75742.1 ead/Ea22-like family protein [Escherichia coli 2-005-03_S4_C1]KDY86993.1 ead/Ea22-like family protein [Escherichia coli 2-474-04_S3_C1]KDY94038.1 ead/Ea22-like family protein [Escherichia coli 2-474-04_S3_C2]KDZ14986.1 ead/Ea22-like family protein [Escherichia coli 2-474-04_S3_C3]KDZ62611